MKKIFLLMALLMPLSVFAVTYNSMAFTTLEGVKLNIALTNLTITVSDGMVKASTDDDVLTFDAGSLAYMEFSKDVASGVDDVDMLVCQSENVKFYTIDGNVAGEFPTWNDARNSLDSGIYIVRLADGSSLKILINK